MITNIYFLKTIKAPMVVVFWMGLITSLFAADVPPTDQEVAALKAFYTATNGDNWTNNSGWWNGAHFHWAVK